MSNSAKRQSLLVLRCRHMLQRSSPARRTRVSLAIASPRLGASPPRASASASLLLSSAVQLSASGSESLQGPERPVRSVHGSQNLRMAWCNLESIRPSSLAQP
jgi:hypothetical protein